MDSGYTHNVSHIILKEYCGKSVYNNTININELLASIFMVFRSHKANRPTRVFAASLAPESLDLPTAEQMKLVPVGLQVKDTTLKKIL